MDENIWIEMTTSKGKRFYYNKLTKEKKWDNPITSTNPNQLYIYGLGRSLNFTDKQKSINLYKEFLKQCKFTKNNKWKECLELLTGNIIFDSLKNIDRKSIFLEFIGKSTENKFKNVNKNIKNEDLMIFNSEVDLELENCLERNINIDSDIQKILSLKEVKKYDKYLILKTFMKIYRDKFRVNWNLESYLKNMYQKNILKTDMKFKDFLSIIKNDEIGKYLLFSTENCYDSYENFIKSIINENSVKKIRDSKDIKKSEINSSDELEEGEIRFH